MKKLRASNIELLRIITMILVMIVHADFKALSPPFLEETSSMPVSSFLRFFTESASIICVNVFVLISGWFGIRFNWKKLVEFLFQVFFFAFIIYIILCFGNHKIIKQAKVVFMTGSSNYWFVKSYLFLYIISPVLNAFVEKSSKNEFKTTLILFFIMQTVYGWLFNGAVWYNKGYSGISFIGLYLLARYIRLYPIQWFCHSLKFDFLIYLSFAVINSLLSFALTKYGYSTPCKKLFYYSSPFVILASLHFLLIFTKFSITSKSINWIAASCFAIYLTHSNPLISKYYYHSINDWFQNENSINFLLYTSMLILFVFWISIFADKIRIYIFNMFLSITSLQIGKNRK